MSETQPLPGAVKRVRAIKDLVYQGKAIRGRRLVRTDGKLGSYDITETPGEELECNQAFAKEVIMNGKAVLVSGGAVEVIPQADGFPIYKSWIKNLSDPDPIFEKCELLKPLFLGDGCHLPEGAKIRIDVRPWDRREYFYSDETQQDQHRFRVLAPSPKRTRLNAIEQSTMVAQLMAKVFPTATAT
jgi:hypothetical protein